MDTAKEVNARIIGAYRTGVWAARHNASSDPGQHYLDTDNPLIVHAFRSGFVDQLVGALIPEANGTP